MFSSLIKDIALGAVRHVATAAGGWLVAQHILNCTAATAAAGTCSDLNGFIGSLCFLGGVAWSAYQKISSKRETAPATPAPKS